jgi:hypothetical protein
MHGKAPSWLDSFDWLYFMLYRTSDNVSSFLAYPAILRLLGAAPINDLLVVGLWPSYVCVLDSLATSQSLSILA